MAVFDSFVDNYTYWTARVNPPRYQQLLGNFVPQHMAYALDAGCGPGQLASYLAQFADTVVGLDISGQMIEIARKKQVLLNKHNIHFTTANLETVPFSSHSFDFIGSDMVLHDTDISQSLPNLIRLLKSGGRLAIRDVVDRRPERAASPMWQMIRTLRRVPRYISQFGLLATIKVLQFELSPTWIHHKCDAPHITPTEFRQIYQHYLPQCTIKNFGWAALALWEAP